MYELIFIFIKLYLSMLLIIYYELTKSFINGAETDPILPNIDAVPKPLFLNIVGYTSGVRTISAFQELVTLYLPIKANITLYFRIFGAFNKSSAVTFVVSFCDL